MCVCACCQCSQWRTSGDQYLCICSWNNCQWYILVYRSRSTGRFHWSKLWWWHHTQPFLFHTDLQLHREQTQNSCMRKCLFILRLIHSTFSRTLIELKGNLQLKTAFPKIELLSFLRPSSRIDLIFSSCNLVFWKMLVTVARTVSLLQD